MGRPILLFTGPWADLSLESLAGKAGGWGYAGFELCCWGDHLAVRRGRRERVHRLAHLGLRGGVPGAATGRDFGRAAAIREAVESDTRRSPRKRRAVRVRSASGATRVRPVLRGDRPRRARRPRRFR